MPEKKLAERARAAKREGKSASTQAGVFVKDEIERVRKGEHGVRSAKQAVAIGLSKARRAGVDLKPPPEGSASAKKEAAHRNAKPRAPSSETAATRKRAATNALRRESSAGASEKALSKQTKTAASKRSAASRSAAAKRGAQTKGAEGRSAAAKKAARTRAARATHH
jgi:hypothetical protein